MPTGYTGFLNEGKDVSFPEFAMRCARAFGAVVEMRDDPMDAEIPSYFPPSMFYFKMLIRSRVELAVMQATTMEHVVILAQAERREQEACWASREEDRLRLKGVYEDMLEEVLAWVPPTGDHQEMKKFMIDQLTGSIDFDCHERDALPPAPAPEEWHASEIKRLESAVERAEKGWEEEVDRCAGRAEWIRALRVSLREPAQFSEPAADEVPEDEPAACDDEIIREAVPGEAPVA